MNVRPETQSNARPKLKIKTTVKNTFAILSVTVGLLMTDSITGLAAQDSSAPASRATISNRLPRRDTDGKIVDAHDGCLHKFGDRYYLYGTAYGFNKNNRYRCYSSVDLVTCPCYGTVKTLKVNYRLNGHPANFTGTDTETVDLLEQE